MKKLIVTCALCGSATNRAQTPHVPITPDEIAADAVNAVRAGASVLHIHARDDEGKNTMDTARFVEVVTKIRKALGENRLDAVINVTSSGTHFPEDMRVAHLPIIKPEMCSYDPGTLNWAHSYLFLNTPAFLERLGKYTQELGVKPEIEIFDAGMMGTVDYYLSKGILKGPCHYQFVLGVPGGMPGNITSLSHLLPQMQPGSTWSVTGIGKSHLPVTLAGLAEGCDGVRVGLEDNVLLHKGVLATNAQLVERVVSFATLLGREIATAAEARKILSIQTPSSIPGF